ncbi:MAG: lytic transglycosylase domain-containing protein [Bacteroidota bacterium]
MNRERFYRLPLLILCAILCVALLVYGRNNNNKEEKKNDPQPLNAAYQWKSPPLPDEISFAGEKVPLERWEIKEQFDRQLTFNYYWQGEILYILKLANRYFPMIEERLKANDIPVDMKYLCVAESKLQNVVSRAGAAGFWQFMPYTAPGFGLEINSEVDERYHVRKSTDAACKYLRAAYNKLGSWTAAAASYNCGQGGYNSNAIFQKTSNYYDLLLPEETNQYIFRILTFKYLMDNAKSLGFNLPDADGYPVIKTKEIIVNKNIPSLVSFAIEHGTTYKMLKQLNPWLRGRSLSVRPGKTYTISLPQAS